MSNQPAPSRPLGLLVVAILGAVACGAGIATQARINGALAKGLGDGVLAAVISFGSGLLIVCVVMLFARSARTGLRTIVTEVRTGQVPWWYVVGGAGGAFLVLSQGLVAGILGVALFSVAVVAGQTLSGLAIDRRGLGTMGPKPVTINRVVGAVLALVAVTLAASSQLHGDFPVWMLALPFVSGLLIGWQQAVNGQVRGVSGSFVTATFINFVVGTTVLLIAMLVHSTWAGWPASFPTEPWLYLGGAVGVIFIAGGAIIVPITGVLVYSLGAVTGQLIASLILDLFFPLAGHPLALATVIGTALTLVAVGIASIPRRPQSAVR